MKYQAIIDPIKKQLAKLDEIIIDSVENDVPLLKQVTYHILNSKGKKIRPALVFLSASAAGKSNADCLIVASVIESIHVATLLHDDVIDNADLRRNKKAANTIWGNEAAILVGDYLFTSSFKRICPLHNQKLMPILLNCTTNIAKGEIFQLTRSFHNTNLDDYFRIVNFKTSSLISAAMELGAILGGASDKISDIFKNVGKKIGLAYQITDDVLDYSLNNKKIGKPWGADLKERKITLPLSHLIENSSTKDREKCLAIIESSVISDNDIETIYHLMLNYNSLKFATNYAKKTIKDACLMLKEVPTNKELNALIEFTKYIGDRKS
ncbi:MAG: polyprenyl synthetase family protein [SAR324 cluster bacterium]|nr:polyprenyl synthetase family protein [SAR324 cluster bacterium]